VSPTLPPLTMRVHSRGISFEWKEATSSSLNLLNGLLSHLLRSVTTTYKQLPRLILRSLFRYVFSIDNIFLFGLFNTVAIALLSHKIIVIQLHQPLSFLGLLLTTPCLFFFDILVLWGLHRLLASTQRVSQIIGIILSIILTICSSAFASMYVQGNVELNWTRSVEVPLSEDEITNFRSYLTGNSSEISWPREIVISKLSLSYSSWEAHYLSSCEYVSTNYSPARNPRHKHNIMKTAQTSRKERADSTESKSHLVFLS